MVKRYDYMEKYGDGFIGESEDGDYVSHDDYAALEARMTGIISGVQLELESELKKRLAAEARVAELEKDAARWRYVADQHSVAWRDEIDDAMSREA